MRVHPTKTLEDEEKRLSHELLAMEEDISVSEFMNKHASEELLDFLNRDDQEKERLRGIGIYIDKVIMSWLGYICFGDVLQLTNKQTQ